ncbi:MAG: flippase [Acidimicrobiia bacterium]
MTSEGAGRGAPRRSESVLSGASVLVAGRYIVAALGLVLTIIIVRRLTVEQFGEYSVVFSLLGIVGFIADLRLSRVVLADVIAADDDQASEIVGSYTGLRFVIGIVSYGVAIGVALIGAVTGSYSHDIVVGTIVLGLNCVVLSVAFGMILLLEARLGLRDVALANVFGQVASLITVVALSASGVTSVVWYIAAAVVNAIVLFGWVLLTVRRVGHFRVRFERSQWATWIKEAAPLALGAALDTVYFRIDVLMLSVMASSRAAGIYNVGYKFSDLIGAVALAVVTPALTLLVAAWPDDPAAFRRVFRHTYGILLVAAVGACVGFVAYAEPLIVTATKEQYRASVDSARLLVVGQGIHYFTLFAFTVLVAVKRNRLYPVAMLLGVVVNVGLNLILIPEYSYLGSGWATVVTEALVLVALGAGVARIPGLRPFPVLPTVKVALAGAATGALGWYLIGRVPWPLGLATMAVVYLALVHALAPNGPGGLRAFAGDPHDDLASVVEEGLDHPDLGTGEVD